MSKKNKTGTMRAAAGGSAAKQPAVAAPSVTAPAVAPKTSETAAVAVNTASGTTAPAAPAVAAPAVAAPSPFAVAAEAAQTAPKLDEHVIQIDGLVKEFGGRRVLDGITLKVRRGETLVIMGASGCGKSTLLRCLIGAYPPDEGSVKLFGKNINELAGKELDSVRRRLGILFQSGALFSSMTVGENVALPLREHTDLSPEMIDLMVKVKLELVGLREAEDLLPAQISGGMAKRAGLARAISLDPELLFYDEPTSGLDPIMTGIIDGLVVDLSRTMNVTSVVVTHDLKSAFRVADRMVVLNQGRIVMDGKPHEVRACTDPFVRRFIQGPVEAKTAIFPRSAMEKHLGAGDERIKEMLVAGGGSLDSGGPALKAGAAPGEEF